MFVGVSDTRVDGELAFVSVVGIGVPVYEYDAVFNEESGVLGESESVVALAKDKTSLSIATATFAALFVAWELG